MHSELLLDKLNQKIKNKKKKVVVFAKVWDPKHSVLSKRTLGKPHSLPFYPNESLTYLYVEFPPILLHQKPVVLQYLAVLLSGHRFWMRFKSGNFEGDSKTSLHISWQSMLDFEECFGLLS